MTKNRYGSFVDEEDSSSDEDRPPNPVSGESQELQWAFIRKVYIIITLQLLLILTVAAVAICVDQFSQFFNTKAGQALYYALAVTFLIALFAISCCYHQHAVNLLLLAVLTVSVAFVAGLLFAVESGMFLFEALIHTSLVLVSLTLYTICTPRDHRFNMGPLIYVAIPVLFASILLRSLSPLGKVSDMIIGALVSIIFSVAIIVYSDFMLNKYSYDQYIPAAVSFYLNFFDLLKCIFNQ